VEQTRIDVDSSDGSLSLATNYDEVEAQWTFGPKSFGYVKTKPAVHYTVRVPPSTALQIDDHESSIDVSGLLGTVRIDTHEGRMVLREISGNIIVDTHEGTATIDGLSGRLDLETHEGRADVRVDSLNEIVADTHEGTIVLSVPATAGFDLSTDLGDDAELRSNVDLTSIRQEEGNYQGAVRGGGPLVRLSSHEGRVTLRSR
jgi:hypothetical protein